MLAEPSEKYSKPSGTLAGVVAVVMAGEVVTRSLAFFFSWVLEVAGAGVVDEDEAWVDGCGGVDDCSIGSVVVLIWVGLCAREVNLRIGLVNGWLG